MTHALVLHVGGQGVVRLQCEAAVALARGEDVVMQGALGDPPGRPYRGPLVVGAAKRFLALKSLASKLNFSQSRLHV